MTRDAFTGAGGTQVSADILRLMLDSAQDAIYAVALPEVRMLFATPAFPRLLGLPPDFLERGFLFAQYTEHVHPDDRKRVQGIMARILASRSDAELPPNPARYRVGPPEGPWRHIEDHYSILRDPDGSPNMIIGNSRDSTEEVEARQALRESETLLRLMADSSPDLFFIIRVPEFSFEYASPSYEALTGYSPQQHYDDPLGVMFAVVAPEWHAQVARWMEEIRQGRIEPTYEYEILDRQGGRRWLLQRQVLVPAPDGRGTLMQGVATDITELRAAQQTFRESEERFRMLAESSQDIFFSVRVPEMRYEFLSARVEELHGVPRQEYYDDPETFLRFLAPEWHAPFRAWMEEIARGQVRESYAFEVLDREGRRRWIEQRAVLVPAPDGRGMLFQGVAQDKTRERRIELALRQSEAHFRQLIEAWPDLVVLSVNLTAGRHEYVSPSMERVLGYAPQEFYDDPGLGLGVVAPHWLDEAHVWLDELRRGITRPCFDFELVRKDGRTIWVQQVCAIQPRSPGQDLVVQFAFRDITEERGAREALRRSEERFRQLAESWSGQVVFRINLRTMKHEYVSPSIEQIFGYTPEQFYRGDPIALGAVAPEWQETVAAWAEENRRGFMRPEYEYEVFDAEGRRRWVHQRGTLLRNEAGELLAVQFIMADITGRKELEKALARSEHKYRTLHESMRDGFAAVDKNGFIIEHNSAFRDMLGYADDEIDQLTYADITPEAWHESERRILEEQVLTRGYSDAYEKEYRRKDGTVFPVSLRAYRTQDDTAAIRYWAIVRDISGQKRAEEELRRSQTFLDCVIEQSPVSMWVSDERGTLVRTNQALRGLFQVTDEEVVGRYNILADEQLRELGVLPLIQRVLDEGGATRFMLPYSTERIGGLELARATSAFLDVTISAVQDAQGRTTNLIIQHVDISEQKRAEEELRRKDALLSAMLRNLPFDFWARDLNLKSIMQSDESIRLWGDLARGDGAEEHIHQETMAIWRETDRKVLAQSPLSEERTLRLPSGEQRIFHSVVAQIRDGENILGLLGINIDITRRRANEEAMRLLNERYTLLAENVADVIWTTDENLRWTYLTPSAERMAGRPLAELLDMCFDELFTPDSLRTVAEAVALRQREREQGLPLAIHTLELELIRADGSVVPLEAIVQPLFGPDGALVGYCGTSRDITERKAAEEALRRSERRFSELICNSWDSLTLLARDGTQIFVSQVVERMLGFKPEELTGIQVIDTMIHPDDRERVREAFLTILREGKGGAQYRHRHKNGGWVHLEAWGTSQLDNPDIHGVVVNVRDITDRMRVEEALKKSERLSRKLLESMHEGVWAFDAAQRTIFVNERLCAMLGYAPEDFGRIGPLDITAPEQRGLAMQRLAERQAGIAGATDYMIVRKDGSRFPAQVMSSPILDEAGRFEGLVCGVVDLTNRQRLELEVRRNQARLDALYELSRLTEATEDQIATFTLGRALELSGSTAGVIFFASGDGQLLEPRAWLSEEGHSGGAIPSFRAEGGGPWSRVFREREPLVLNDVPGLELGLPPGHPVVRRFLGVPALDGGEAVAVLGLTNKDEPYEEADILQLTLLVDGMWRIVRARRDERSIRASLREKEALLREVHHRVKNNLQVVSSLLDMSARRLAEPQARRAMAEVQAKVQAMSLIHILLYGTGGGQGIRLGEYVSALFRQLREVYGGAGLTLSARLRLGGMMLGLEQAVPLGLALNEALANVFKHAAGGGPEQSVEVQATREPDGRVALTVRDHGPGLPPDMEARRAGGLGLRLMQGLVVHQLGGEFTLENAEGGGVVVTLRFRPTGEPTPAQ